MAESDVALRHEKKRRHAATSASEPVLHDPKEDAVEQKWLPGHLNARIGNGEHPFLYSKAMMKKGGPAREKMASRLEELGVTGVRE